MTTRASLPRMRASTREDALDEYPCASPAESDALDSDSDEDARYGAYAGANATHAELRDRPAVFLRRNLSYHQPRFSASARWERAMVRMRACAALEASTRERVETTYEYEGCGTMSRTRRRGYGCAFCRVAARDWRGLMTHLRCAHDLFRYSGKREGGTCAVTVRPRAANFDEAGLFRLRSRLELRTPTDKEFVFIRGKNGDKDVFRERVSRYELVRRYASGVLEVPTSPVWRDVAEADQYESILAEKRRRQEAERKTSMPRERLVCKKIAGPVRKAEQKAKLPPPKRPFRPFYNSRSFIKQAGIPELDSDDENVSPAQIVENRRVLNDFVDYSQEEIEFMETWNEIATRFRPLADYEAPALCHAFVRVHGKRIASSRAFFGHFTVTLLAMYENGILNRRAMLEVLTACKQDVPPQWRAMWNESLEREIENCPIAVFHEFPKFESTLDKLDY